MGTSRYNQDLLVVQLRFVGKWRFSTGNAFRGFRFFRRGRKKSSSANNTILRTAFPSHSARALRARPRGRGPGVAVFPWHPRAVICAVSNVAFEEPLKGTRPAMEPPTPVPEEDQGIAWFTSPSPTDRGAVSTATNHLSWRARFHPGYTRDAGELASTSSRAETYVPNVSMGPPASRDPREGGPGENRLPGLAKNTPEVASDVPETDAPPPYTNTTPNPETQTPPTHRYETSVANATAWANALLRAGKAQRSKRGFQGSRKKRVRMDGDGCDAARAVKRDASGTDTNTEPSGCSVARVFSTTIQISKEMARHALGSERTLEALLRGCICGGARWKAAGSFAPEEHAEARDTSVSQKALEVPDLGPSLFEKSNPAQATTGYQGDFLTVPVEKVSSLWSSSSLEPVGARKDITCVVLAPRGERQKARETVREVGGCYSAMRLGEHDPVGGSCMATEARTPDYGALSQDFVFEYDCDEPEAFPGMNKKSFDFSLQKVADTVVAAVTERNGPVNLLVYVIAGGAGKGSSFCVQDAWVTETYCAVVCSNKIEGKVGDSTNTFVRDSKIDFQFVSRNDSGRGNLTPETVRQIAVNTYRRSVRPVRRVASSKAVGLCWEDENARSQKQCQDFTRRDVLARNVTSVSRKDHRLATYDPLVVLRKGTEKGDADQGGTDKSNTHTKSDGDAFSSECEIQCETHCAFTATAFGPVTWVVASWADSFGEALETDARFFSNQGDSRKPEALTVAESSAERVAAWLFDRTVSFATGIAVSAGEAMDVDTTSVSEPEKDGPNASANRERAGRRRTRFFAEAPVTERHTRAKYGNVAVARVGGACEPGKCEIAARVKCRAEAYVSRVAYNREQHKVDPGCFRVQNVVLGEMRGDRGLDSLRVTDVVRREAGEKGPGRGGCDGDETKRGVSAKTHLAEVYADLAGLANAVCPTGTPLVPPHARTCVFFAETLRALEEIAAGGGVDEEGGVD